MKRIIIITLLAFLGFCGKAQSYNLNSPDENLTAYIEINKGVVVKLIKDKDTLFAISGLSLELSDGMLEMTVKGAKKSHRNFVNEDINPAIHEKGSVYKNCYNELIVSNKSNFSVTFRLFNEGLAYRISTSAKDSLVIVKENLSIQFQEEDSMRYQASESFNSSYETPYEYQALCELEKDKLINLPVLIEKHKGSFVLITESDLYNYPGLWLKGSGGVHLEATNPQFPKRLINTGNIYQQGQVAESYDYIAKVHGTRTYPWRLFAVAENETGLISNNMVYLLASPTELKDISWIRPGVVMFDWWAKNSIYGVDFKSGINTETAKYFIDFCAENGFRYFLFDDGWCPKEDLLNEVPELNMTEVTAYAKGKNVDVLLWVIWSTLQKQWDLAFDQFEKWGVKGIKMDFMNRDDQQMVEFYEAVARKTAEKKMVVNFHGAYKPSGLSRLYPNVLTREALIEFEYNGGTKYDNTEHHNILPYIRMFTGAMDYIPATMRNSTKDNFRAISDYPMGQGTRAHAMALFVILSSPMEMLPDSPSDYYREKECLDFLAKIPLEWDETRLLKGQISKYTVLARRSGEDWYIGAITNQDERTFELPTDFLKQGSYNIEAIEDGINADTRASDYKKINERFRSGEVLKLKLASGGGWLARITRVK